MTEADRGSRFQDGCVGTGNPSNTRRGCREKKRNFFSSAPARDQQNPRNPGEAVPVTRVQPGETQNGGRTWTPNRIPGIPKFAEEVAAAFRRHGQILLFSPLVLGIDCLTPFPLPTHPPLLSLYPLLSSSVRCWPPLLLFWAESSASSWSGRNH